jgi:hypothetical protein
MRLWIDDVRQPPKHFTMDAFTGEKYDVIWAKTSKEASQAINQHKNKITVISFDHDLGGVDSTIPVANLIEQEAFNGGLKRIKWYIHSMNPVGRQNLNVILKNADKYWSEWENDDGS